MPESSQDRAGTRGIHRAAPAQRPKPLDAATCPTLALRVPHVRPVVGAHQSGCATWHAGCTRRAARWVYRVRRPANRALSRGPSSPIAVRWQRPGQSRAAMWLRLRSLVPVHALMGREPACIQNRPSRPIYPENCHFLLFSHAESVFGIRLTHNALDTPKN